MPGFQVMSIDGLERKCGFMPLLETLGQVNRAAANNWIRVDSVSTL